MTSILTALKDVLAELPDLVNVQGDLIRSRVEDRALNMQPDLLGALAGNDSLREAFFEDVGGTLVFDKVLFMQTVTMRDFLPDSFTAYGNKIGLSAAGEALRKGREVVLDWPYKDCVLAGGMTREDRGGSERFVNRIVAPDEVIRLEEPKALCGWERWDADAVAAGKPAEVDEVTGKENLLIKGNNLFALHSLKAHFGNRVATEGVKLIYIDPPYNTGNDGFRYNDRFTHSTWLTFMQDRIRAACSVLREDGAIFIQIDEKELGYLLPLADEVIGRENRVSIVTVKTSDPSGHKVANPSLYDQSEFILVYARNRGHWKYQPIFVRSEYDYAYNKIIRNIEAPASDWLIESLFEVVADEQGFNNAKEARKALGRSVFAQFVADYALQNADKVFQPVTIADDAANHVVEARNASRDNPDGILQVENRTGTIYIVAGKQIYFYSNKIRNVDGVNGPTKLLTSIWNDISYNGIAQEGGAKLKNGKKPEALLRRVIQMSTEPNDLVFDFFAGSGTTAAVAHKMGRRWIAVEQMDYVRDLTVERLKRVVAGEQGGVSKVVKWPDTGGGSFIYTEIASEGQDFVSRVDAANEDELDGLRDELTEAPFLRHDIDPDGLRSSDWAEHSPTMKRRTLREAVAADHLYVNVGDMDDEMHGLSERDRKLTRAFYGMSEAAE
ncbi:DNA methyltransferase [Roseovarius sp. B08]|uniref:DNA methyltransferase n=1 Tax=Roseovarius sp. B08 TaxID=3449223 RepID=UPI003EDBD3EB